MGVLEVEEQASPVEDTGDSPPQLTGGSAVLYFLQQRELMLLCMKLEQEKEPAVQKVWQGVELEKVLKKCSVSWSRPS